MGAAAFALVALVAGSCHGQEAGEPEQLCTVSGALLSPGGEPVSDAEAIIRWYTWDSDQPGRHRLGFGGGRLTTGPNGEFRFTEVLPGFVQVDAAVPGMLRTHSELTWLKPGRTMEGLKLRSRGYGGGIVGTVVDEEGRPVEGAYVNVNIYTGETDLTEALRKADEGRYTTRTDPDGWFAKDALAPAKHDLSVYYSGYPPYHRSGIEVAEGSEVAVEVVLRRWLPDTWTLAGIVTDANGAGVPGARIDAMPGPGAKQATSGDAGEFLLYGLPLGTSVSVRAYHPQCGVWEGELRAREPEYREDTIALERHTQLTGIVRDPDGQPVAEQEIRIDLTRSKAEGEWASLPEIQVTTDEDGRYALVGLLPGEWRLRARSASWRTYSSQPFVVPAGADEVRHDITFPPEGTITGVVLGLDREPLADRHVLLHSGERRFDRTLARPAGDGSFRFTRVEPGTYYLSATAPGFWPAILACELAEGANIEGLEVQLGVGASVSGVVLDAAGDPVPGTRVLVDSRTTEAARGPQLGVALACRGCEVARTGPDGRFAIRGVTPGPVGLVAFKGFVDPLYYFSTTMVVEDEGGTPPPVRPARVRSRRSDGTFAEAGGVLATLQDGQDVTGADIQLAKWMPDEDLCTVTGRVLDPAGQLPTDSPVQVAISEGPLGPDQVIREKRRVSLGRDADSADNNGRFEIRNAVPGKYYVIAGADTTFLQVGHVKVAAGEETALRDLPVPTAGALQGNVRDEKGEPITDGWVVAARIPHEARTLWQDETNPRSHRVGLGADGSYRFDHLDAGFWFVMSAGDKLPGSEIKRVFINGATESLNFRHAYAGSMRGRVMDPDGNPVPRASVRCEGDRYSWTPTVRSDQDGRYELAGLPLGEYELRAAHPSFLPESPKEVELSDEHASALADFVLRPGGLITGTLVYADGSAVTDGGRAFVLELYRDGHRVQPLFLRDDGTFRSQALEAGRYVVRAQRQGAEAGDAGESETVTVSAGETTQNVVVALPGRPQ